MTIKIKDLKTVDSKNLQELSIEEMKIIGGGSSYEELRFSKWYVGPGFYKWGA